jgi:hypothetical protein
MAHISCARRHSSSLYLLLPHAFESLNRLPEVRASQAKDTLRANRKEVLSTDIRHRCRLVLLQLDIHSFRYLRRYYVARMNPSNSLVQNLGWGVMLNAFYLPGPFIGGYLSDKIGRRKTQFVGYFLQAILGFVMGGTGEQIQAGFRYSSSCTVSSSPWVELALDGTRS